MVGIEFEGNDVMQERDLACFNSSTQKQTCVGDLFVLCNFLQLTVATRIRTTDNTSMVTKSGYIVGKFILVSGTN